jgi:hypothetical protein
VSWDEKLAFDVSYVDHRYLAVDVWTLVKTARVVPRGERVAAPYSATRHKFLRNLSTIACSAAVMPSQSGEPA